MARSAAVAPPTVKLLALVAVPPSVWTLIRPEVAPAGTVAVICVGEFMVKDGAGAVKGHVGREYQVRAGDDDAAARGAAGRRKAGDRRRRRDAWPSILFRSTAARFGGRAVKKVKPVSFSMAVVGAGKFCQGRCRPRVRVGNPRGRSPGLAG